MEGAGGMQLESWHMADKWAARQRVWRRSRKGANRMIRAGRPAGRCGKFGKFSKSAGKD